MTFDLKTITSNQVRNMPESIFLETPPELPEPDETNTTPGNDRDYSWEPTEADPDGDDDETEDVYAGEDDDEDDEEGEDSSTPPYSFPLTGDDDEDEDECDLYFGGIDDES